VPPPTGLAVGLCGAALVAGFAVAPTVRLLRRNHKTVSLAYEQHKTLDQALTRALRFVDVRRALRHSVALVGVVDDSETVWSLHVPYDAVSGEVGPRTRFIVEPSPKAYSKLGKLGLNSARPHVVPRPGWHRGLITRDWDMWIPDGPQPVRLGPPTAR